MRHVLRLPPFTAAGKMAQIMDYLRIFNSEIIALVWSPMVLCAEMESPRISRRRQSGCLHKEETGLCFGLLYHGMFKIDRKMLNIFGNFFCCPAG